MPKQSSTSSPSSHPRFSSRNTGQGVRLHCADKLPGVTLTVAKASGAVQPRHVHDSLVLGVVTAGTRRIDVGGTEFLVPPDTAFVLAPGLAHACAPATPGDCFNDNFNGKFNDKYDDKYDDKPGCCSYLALSIRTEALPPELSKLTRWGMPLPLPVPVRTDDPALVEALLRLAEAMTRPAGALERQSLLAVCLERLIGLCGTGGNAPPPAKPLAGMAGADKLAEMVHVARARIDEGFPEGMDLSELAEACGVGMFALHRAFTRVVGLPPHAYQTHLRLRRAKELLRGGASLSEAALDAGFCDQAHMTRHFARCVGLSPAQYARAHRHA